MKDSEKEDMREKILDISKMMFVEKGYDKTSLRSIAKKLSISPGTIYLYFKNKDDLFFAIHEEGFKLLNERMRAKMGIKEPVLRLKEIARAYIQFAWDFPEYYDLMFSQSAPINAVEDQHAIMQDIEDAMWPTAMNTFGCLHESVEHAIEQGVFIKEEVAKITFSLWASVHGMVSLCLCNRMKMFPDHNVEELILNSIDLVTDLFKKKEN